MKTTNGYGEDYFADIARRQRYLFSMIDELEEYSTFDVIDAYFKTSAIRKKIDEGNIGALNKSPKQCFNDIDFDIVSKTTIKEHYDNILLNWISDIYVLLQYTYKLYCYEIVSKIPSRLLYKAYFPLHETSRKNACTKLYDKYLKG